MSYVNIGKVTEELNELAGDKVAKGHEVIEFQAPTASNGYTWYRKYADGWVEQGGQCQPASNSNITVQLPISFIDTNYNINAIVIDDATYAYADKFAAVRALTTSTITFAERYISGNSGLPIKWEAKGMYAQ